MPQIDSVTFLSQLFWLVVIFFLFYSFILSDVLPSLSRILKVRAKKLTSDSHRIRNDTPESREIVSNYDSILIEARRVSRNLVHKTDNISKDWVNTSLTNSFLKDLNLGVKSYLQLSGEVLAKKHLLIHLMNSNKNVA